MDAVSPSDDTPATLEVKISDDGTNHLVFKFAETIIANAVLIDRGDRDPALFLRASFSILTDAAKHAAHATQILADIYLLPIYGWH